MNFEKVFQIFKRNYETVPLEVFGNNPYKTLVSTLMSARTKDEVTLASSQRLFAKAKNFYNLSKLDTNQIAKLIYPVGFYKTKAMYIKKLSEKVIKKFDGQVPSTLRGLTSLPGVGRKTANLVINRAFGKPAIAVDTHVHRISNMLGWVNTNSPEKTEKELMKILPKKYWSDTNRLFVSIGRQFTTRKRLEEFLTQNGLLSMQ